MGEMVYVINATGLEKLEGLRNKPFSRDALDLVGLNSCILDGQFIDRSEAEKRPMYKQIIPYVILRSGDNYLCYCRTGSEQRLEGGYSIGLGGHINPVDAEKIDYKNEMLWNNMRRELDEELDLQKLTVPEITGKLNFHGVLYDNSNEVGRVHLGVVYLADVPVEYTSRIKIKSEGKELTWKNETELRSLGDKLENWSKIVLGF